MLKTTERLELILALDNNGLDLELIRNFDRESLLRFCGGLEARKTPRDWYAGHAEIQKELIKDDRFFFYLEKLNAARIAMAEVNSLLKTLRENGDRVFNYPAGQLISSMALTAGFPDIRYDYLKNFSGWVTDKEQKGVIIRNLRLYLKPLNKPVSELSEAERSLFTEPCLTDISLVPDNVSRAFYLLAHQPELLNLIRYFFTNEIKIDFTAVHYESLSREPVEILNSLKKLRALIDAAVFEPLMNRWTENNCPCYDLSVLLENLGCLPDEQLDGVLYSRSGYINLIYGNKIKDIPLSELPKYKEEILIYAILNKKHHFIRLVEENYGAFAALESRSVLFRREFYTRFINLNALNADNLRGCGRMNTADMLFGQLEDKVYTFEEFKALYGLPTEYFKLYSGLNIPCVDGRLVVLRQMAKQKLLASVILDEHIAVLAAKLSEKPLSVWRGQDFGHIYGITPQDAVELLIRQDKIGKFIPQMKTRTDLRLAARNWENAQNYGAIEEMKADLVNIDPDWGELVEKMGFTEGFIRQNRERVLDFLCQNGAYIVKTYCEGLGSDTLREALRRIVKAELMGEFNTLKYYADDLCKETDYPLTNAQKSFWTENTETRAEYGLLARERDDFYSTLLLGTVPYNTCLSYIDGEYKDCLLSSFDSNKKVLYAYLNGKAAGRAIVRLTKGRFGGAEKPESEKTSLTFVDLEADETPQFQNGVPGENDRLVIFLECPYISGISDEKYEAVQKAFINLMAKKAVRMGAMLVLSDSYRKVCGSHFTRTIFRVYISKSKAGAQYLDSLNGSAGVSDEGGYRVNNFFIQQNDIT